MGGAVPSAAPPNAVISTEHGARHHNGLSAVMSARSGQEQCEQFGSASTAAGTPPPAASLQMSASSGNDGGGGSVCRAGGRRRRRGVELSARRSQRAGSRLEGDDGPHAVAEEGCGRSSRPRCPATSLAMAPRSLMTGSRTRASRPGNCTAQFDIDTQRLRPAPEAPDRARRGKQPEVADPCGVATEQASVKSTYFPAMGDARSNWTRSLPCRSGWQVCPHGDVQYLLGPGLSGSSVESDST
jgi:hypothetical protein